MRELPREKLLIYAAALACVFLCLLPLLHRLPRTRGRVWYWHVVFVLFQMTCLWLLPDFVQTEVFSPGGVVVIGTILPIYESIVAVCSIGQADDTSWLQYWIASASVSFATEFMDEIRHWLPSAGEHWYEFEFFLNLWLLFPLTDGSALLYDCITRPFLAPMARKLKSRCEGYIGIFMTIVNSSYIWLVWFCFLRMPEEARRFLVVGLGTVYPIAASTVALTTRSTKFEETQWLTYWATYSILFLLMDYLENFIWGRIPGFYSATALATLYLFLPAFNGAEVVFRRVLVPLSGQYENMLLHDAYLVKLGMIQKVPKKHQARVLQQTAELFGNDKTD